jgi:RNA polymerase primary sigma factor
MLETGAHLMTRSQLEKSRTLTNPLELYLNEIRTDDLLTAAEEGALAKAIAQGDREAKARLIRSNLRLVVKIARDYLNRGLSLEDLIGEGNLGLIRATEEFDPSFNVRFCTYAAHWIKQAIRHALTNTTATIRLPAHMVGLLTKWQRTERILRRELGRPPMSDEIADALTLTDSQRELVSHAQRACRLRQEGVPDDDGFSCSSDELSSAFEAPGTAIEAAEDRRDLSRRLDRLDARERTIVTLRFGLGGTTPMTLKEVGRKLGVTREWVRKIEIRAVRKLDDDYVTQTNQNRSFKVRSSTTQDSLRTA